jgi:hypothetical protein
VSEQRQRAAAQSIAIQSGGDTIITQGITARDMREIFGNLATLIPVFTAIAREIANERLGDLEQRLIERFSDPNRANAEAFKDPDFQYLLTRVQQAYARSGDEAVRDILIDLIASRSKETTRTRLSLTLNDAVEKATVLTKNEFAELSLCYLIRHTVSSPPTLAAFGRHLSQLVVPLLPDISRNQASYQYIQAQSCGAIDALGECGLIWAFRNNYCGILSEGTERSYLVGVFGEERVAEMEKTQLIIPCVNNRAKLQLNAPNRNWFDGIDEVRRLPKSEQDRIWSTFDSSVWSGETLIEKVETVFPEIRTLYDLWEQTPLKRLSLTTIGIAVGHANLSRVAPFGSPLSTWIQ